MSALDAALSDETVVGGLRQLGAMPAWLTVPADGTRVGAGLAGAVPELAAGTWRIERCEPKLRLKDGTAWTSRYHLALVDPAGQHRSVRLAGEYRPARGTASGPSTVRGDLGAAGWEVDVPSLGLSLRTEPDDGELPALAVLTDPQRARVLLEESLARTWPGIRIDTCAPEVMRYKPGSRCTVRYRLTYASGPSGPASVVAKTYRGDKGANAYRGMRALDEAGIPAEIVDLAPALDYRPDVRVLVQGSVDEEETLKDLARRAGAHGDSASFTRLADEAAKAAVGLAAVHGSGVAHGELVTWEDQHREVGDLAGRLAGAVPETAGAVSPFLERLAAAAAGHPADGSGPAHRSFRPAQVLLSTGRIAFIDFDGLCTAEPAMDVALFRAALRDAVMRAVPRPDRRAPVLASRLAAVDEVCAEFLSRYRAAGSVSPQRVALWESLYVLTSVLHCWTKLQPDRLVPRMAALEHHVFGPATSSD